TQKIWATNLSLEPVTTVQLSNRITNPCGIILCEPATFQMDISPSAFSDSLIVWSATPEGRVQFDRDICTGRRISVVGVAEGDVTITANIAGYTGPPPLIHARVMRRTTVPVYAWIVCGTNGVPAIGESDLHEKFSEINQIWNQAGITWQLAEVNFVTNQSWLRISSGINGNYESICAYGSPHNGVELYCVQETANSLGMTTKRGVVVCSTESPVVYAHEFGHLCNLRDIYKSHSPESLLTVQGLVGKARLPLDWSSAFEEGYYQNDLFQSDIIGRLLMCGRYTPGQGDISAGDIEGLWNNRYFDHTVNRWVDHYEIAEVPCGFLEHGEKQPIGK
ncbi:MAG: hypothetical protein ACI4QT_07010, partial [Kiritimatiellia bacterium]